MIDIAVGSMMIPQLNMSMTSELVCLGTSFIQTRILKSTINLTLRKYFNKSSSCSSRCSLSAGQWILPNKYKKS